MILTRRVPVAVAAIVGVTTLFFVAELIAGGAHGGTDRLTDALGMWPARLPAQLWRMVTVVLVNPAYPTRSGRMSAPLHWLVNMLLVVTAGRRVERRLGPAAVIAAYIAGAVASSAFWWATGQGAGPSGGSSGGTFALLGGVILLGLLAGGSYRSAAAVAFAVTLYVLRNLYFAHGVELHLIAMAAGAVAVVPWRYSWLRTRPSRMSASDTRHDG